jgi:hypothetical protein
VGLDPTEAAVAATREFGAHLHSFRRMLGRQLANLGGPLGATRTIPAAGCC